MPLTFRLLLILVAGALLFSGVVAIQGAEQSHAQRVADRRESVERLGVQLARRAGPLLEKNDEMRLAVLVAATADLGDCRVVMIGLDAVVRLDTELALGGKKLSVLTDGSGSFHRSIEEGVSEVLVPVPAMRGRAGEVRLRYSEPERRAGDFSFGLFGVSFLACLSLIALACVFSHHFASRIRRAAQVAHGLSRGETTVELPTSRVREIADLNRGLNEIGVALQHGLVGTERGLVEMAMQLVDTIEHHSSVTPGHGERTRRYARLLGERLGLVEADLRDLELAAQLHDLGKACVRPSVLTKTGPLDREERASLREHPGHATAFLEGQPTLRDVARTIRHHHEKYDGTGYPDGLRGDRIPLPARIVAIADAYDQVTSRSIYGDPMGWSEALAKLAEDRGTHFDPWLLDLFSEEIEKSPLPTRPLRPVVISTEGVLPYKAAEEVPEQVVEVLDEETDAEQALFEDVEVVAEDHVPGEPT